MVSLKAGLIKQPLRSQAGDIGNHSPRFAIDHVVVSDSSITEFNDHCLFAISLAELGIKAFHVFLAITGMTQSNLLGAPFTYSPARVHIASRETHWGIALFCAAVIRRKRRIGRNGLLKNAGTKGTGAYQGRG